MKVRNEIMRFFGLHPQNDVRRKFAFTFAEGATHVDNSNNKRRFAFTLAEVLITLGIIGVVAALTIPTLINNYQTKSWNTAASVFEAKFTESLKTMNVQGQLGKYGKYNTTEGFVEELQKHFKIANVCDRDHLMQCFEKTTTWGDKEADLSNIKESKDFVQLAEGEEDWGTNVMGVQFANGVTGLIAYNPKCKSDPHDNRINGSNCYALLYDTSGFSEPNELGKDLRSTANVKNLAGGDCVVEIDGLCITKTAFIPTPLSKAECEAEKGNLGIDACLVDNDYFAGAAKQCGGVNKIINKNDSIKIAEYLFNIKINNDDDLDSLFNGKQPYELDATKTSAFGFTGEPQYFVWLSDNYNGIEGKHDVAIYYSDMLEIDVSYSGDISPNWYGICKK